MLTVQCNWTRIGKEVAVGALMLVFASGVSAVASTAVVSGVVRDTQGVAQMGAMVQVLAIGSANIATAYTDLYGRYRVTNLLPGKYQVRASAALFAPATRRNLQLATGMRATVNLTLTMLTEPAAWLPAERRKPDEPGDDWTWTLRSAANRPILRVLGDGEIVTVAPGTDEASQKARIEARAAVQGGDGGFGEGGVRNAVVLERATPLGSDMLVRTNVAVHGAGGSPSMEVDAGFGSSTPFLGSSRLVVSYASHPEMMSGDSSGMQLMRMASARQMHLGEAVDVDAGATVYAIHTSGTALMTRPFLQVTVHPGEVWALRYKLAASRDVQSYDGLDSIATDLPVTAMSDGRLRSESGMHQEISVSRKAGRGQIQAALYHDAIDRTAVAGTGAMAWGDLTAGGGSNGVVADTATDSFRLLGAGYAASGVRVAISEPLSSWVWASVEYDSGAALSARSTSGEMLQQVSADLHAEEASAATAAVKGHLLCTGTQVRAAYRWQPERLVTAVAPYEGPSDQGYLSFYVRQAMRWGDRLPPGLEATIDVTNLLAEGYRPFLSADGRTLFLAQSARTIEGGLSFTF